MTYEILTGLVLFAFASSITPGPNNIMLMASGVNFGLRRTVPHMLGVSLGHGAMTVLLGLGLVQVFVLIPWLRTVLTVISVAYLLWLAWKVANAAPPAHAKEDARPLTFLQAAGFQWVNPKAVYMSIYAQTTYAPEGTGWSGAVLVGVVFALVNLPSVATWAWGGTQVRRWLAAPGRLRVFNWTMAALLVLSLYPIILGEG
ncbi:LysE family translocator [Gymnodinialimonas ceratoperidinii]|uniref:LysE family translocator n=1 Tax=Gymnodinialimonas ceratoperidinii TaxID=2856823 RepID=A0A8F6YBS2_9RHOB|nr:LysE family translocator [Gymnodinialimonas ceratoperidinii]QXT41244.1 LysE family translocator [Gymnodinialimonas ceratoperidinii]